MKEINFANHHLGHNAFCSTVFPLLSTNPPVEKLLLNGNQLSSLSMKELAAHSSRLTTLYDLELANNHLGQTGLVNLQGIFSRMSPVSPLVFFGLAHNDIRDIAIESLAPFLSVHFPKLQVLDLRLNLITDVGIDRLIPALKKYRSFTLYISGNSISNKKITELQQIPGLVIDLKITETKVQAPAPKPMSPTPDWVLVDDEKSPQELPIDPFDAIIATREGEPLSSVATTTINQSFVLIAPPTPSAPSSPSAPVQT